jgi:hypothetical protein
MHHNATCSLVSEFNGIGVDNCDNQDDIPTPSFLKVALARSLAPPAQRNFRSVFAQKIASSSKQSPHGRNNLGTAGN